MLTHLEGMPIKGEQSCESGRPGGLPAMAAPKSGLAAAAKLALWPGYGLGHDAERQNQDNGTVKHEKDPPGGGGRVRNREKL